MLHDSGATPFRIAGVAQERSADIRNELVRILDSRSFQRADRASKLLTFLVGAVLAGRAKALSEYLLASEVFDKPESFDPATDAIVRTEMGRLRKKLQEYYDEEGASAAVVISLPVRSYCPAFDFREAPVRAKRYALPRWFDPKTAAAAALALVVIAGAWWGIYRLATRTTSTAASPARSVLVLPFSGMGGESGQESLADGITDDLIQELSRVRGLHVLSRTTSFSLRGHTDDIRQLGRRLNATMALEGTVFATATIVRISARLFNTADGYSIWSRSFEHGTGEVATVAGIMAASITEALRDKLVTLPPHLVEPHVPKPEVYQRYLQGRATTRQLTPAAILKGIHYFEEAAAADPRYAPAFGELAEHYALMALYGALVPEAGLGKAKAAALEALKLDPDQPSAHAAMGIVKGMLDWNWPAAESEFRTAIELDPNDTFAREAYALGFLTPRAQWDAALAQLAHAEALDPLSPRMMTATGMVYYLRHDYDSSLTKLQQALRTDPTYSPARLAIGAVHEARRDYAAAISAFRSGYDEWDANAADAALAHTYAVSGRRSDAERLLQDLIGRRKQGQRVWPSSIASIYAGLGKPNDAIQWLEEGLRERCSGIAFVNVNPRLDPVRDHPRFTSLVKTMGLL